MRARFTAFKGYFLMKKQKQKRIPLKTLEQVQKPISEAQGLPNEVYSDPHYFNFERDHIFAKTWVALTYSSDCSSLSYAVPIEFMGLPLMIFRDADGELKVFHNVCSHRGMIVLAEARTLKKSISCPYHGWTYDLAGNLKGTPNIGGAGIHKVEGFSCESHRLREVTSFEWMGIVFINIEGSAPDFEDYIAPLEKRWEPWTGKKGLRKVSVASEGSHMDLQVNCNWKLAIENYCEAYHLPMVHPGLNTYSPLKDHINVIASENMSGQYSQCYTLASLDGLILPQFEAWPSEERDQAEYISVFPNLLLGVQIDHMFSIILQPLSESATLERVQLSFLGDGASSDKYADCRENVLSSWKEVFEEDIFVVEGMQKGRRSTGFEGGVFTPLMDESTHHFHGWLAKRYQDAQTELEDE